eukprot:14691745-Heterocapsa_arctica.AAC.1
MELNMAVVRVADVGSYSPWSCRQLSRLFDSLLSRSIESARPLHTCTGIPYSRCALPKCSGDMSTIQM